MTDESRSILRRTVEQASEPLRAFGTFPAVRLRTRAGIVSRMLYSLDGVSGVDRDHVCGIESNSIRYFAVDVCRDMPVAADPIQSILSFVNRSECVD
jgi:hypothetical protein